MTSKPRAANCLAIALAVLALAGCSRGPFEIAPVSGSVTLNGEPLADAAVNFKPQRQSDSPIVGPGSVCVTDSEGRFTLKTHDGDRGAVVGTHVVSVSTYAAEMVDPVNSDQIRILSKERVPKRYRSPSELQIEVASGGTDEANFELNSR